MADKIRVELEVDPQKGMVTLRNFDREMEKAISGAGGSARAADQAGSAFDGMGRKIEGAGRKSESAGAMFTKMAGALGIAFSVQAVVGWTDKVHQAHATYQRDLNMVSTMLDRNSLGQERYTYLLKQYGSGLDNLSVQFGESTRTLSKGLYDILSASVAPAQALSVLKTSARAAQAGFTDTAVAVDFITSAMNAYGMSAERAGNISDVAFATVASGKTTFAELAAAVGRVAPQAAASNISLEQLMAMLANVTRQGINTNEAVTAINALLVQFSRGSKEATKAWAEITKGTALAGTEFGVARLRGDELFKTLEVLKNATDQQRMAVLQEITAVKAANAMAQDSVGLRQDLNRTVHASGETQKAYGKIVGSSEQISNQYKQAVEALERAFGKGLAPSIDAAKKSLTEWAWVAKTALEEGTIGDIWEKFFTGYSRSLSTEHLRSQIERIKEDLDTLGDDSGDAGMFGFAATAKRAEFLRAKLSELEAQLTKEDALAEYKKGVEDLGASLKIAGDEANKFNLGGGGKDNTKADLEALANLDKKLSDEMAKAFMDSFAQRERALDAYVAAYKAAGGDIRKIEGDIATLRDINYQSSALAALEAERKKSEALGKAAVQRGQIREREWKAEDQGRDRRTAAEREAAVLMAQYTGDSLELQRLEHEKFIDDWIAKGLERGEAEDLWLAKQNQVAQKTGSIWASVTDSMRQQWTYTWTDPFSESLNSAQDFFDRWVDSLDQMWRRGLSSMMNAMNEWLFNLAGALGKDIWASLFGGSGGNTASLLGSLFGFGKAGASASGGVASTVAGFASAYGVGAGFDALLGSLGLGASSFAGTTGALMAAGPAATAAAEAALAAQVAAAYQGLGLTSTAATTATTAATTAAGTGASGGLSGAGMAAMFASPAGAMAMAALPGMAGMMLSQMGFLMDGAMTPEKAEGNWRGQTGWLEAVAEQMGKAGAVMSSLTEQEGLFSQAAIEAWQAFEKLGTVAGWSAEQLDAAKAGLSPYAQALLESGRIADGVEDDVRSLAKAIAKGREEFDWSAEAIDGYQAKIDALAESYGLTGEEAEEFSRQMWELSETVHTGAGVMIEAGDAAKELADDVVGSMNGIANSTDGITALTETTGDLLGMLQGVAQAGREAANSVGSVGKGGGKGSVGIGVKHSGGQGPPAFVYRHDGWPALGPNEYMAIMENEEWVIRSRAVNSRTAPVLNYINNTGELPGISPGRQQPAPVFNMTFHIHTQNLDDPMVVDDVARKIEAAVTRIYGLRSG